MGFVCSNADCRRDRTNDEPDTPCSDCGTLGRHADVVLNDSVGITDNLGTSTNVTIADEVGFSDELPATVEIVAEDSFTMTDEIETDIHRDGDRTWQEKWRAALRAFEALKAIYSGEGPTDSDAQVEAVGTFFTECYQLKDWLKNDPNSGVDGSTVETFVHDSPSLDLAGAIANTYKHHTMYKGKTTAEVTDQHTKYSGDKHPTTMRIGWEAGDGTTGNEDALDLAMKAIADWRKFFGLHGLTE